MHDHVFSETEDSLRGEMLGLFDTIIDKFEGIIYIENKIFA